MKKHPLADILPDYGDRDFVLGILREYVLDHLVKHLEDSSPGNWNFKHAKYANQVLVKLGGTKIDVKPFAKSGGIFKDEEGS